MCLILVACRAHPDYPLLLAANRDEFFARPTARAAHWEEDRSVVGGRDLEKGGSWLAAQAGGRLAAVTNYRDGARRKGGLRSRGLIVRDFVLGTEGSEAFLEALRQRDTEYDGYNLIIADREQAFHYSNISSTITPLAPGVHGLSNHLLNTPWPKVQRGRVALERLLRESRETMITGLFDALQDASVPADHDLPATGVSLSWERLLSTAFIASPDYGTRSSSIVLVDAAGGVEFLERSFDPGSPPGNTQVLRLPSNRDVAPAT